MSGDLLDVNKSEEKYLISFSSGESLWAKEARERRPKAPKRGAHTPSKGGTWSPLLGPSSVVWSPPFYRSLRLGKKPTPYFSPDLQRRRRRRKSSPTPGEGRSCCTGAYGEGEIDTIVITTLPRRGRRHLHQHHHHHHHHLQDPPRSPHSL